MGTKCKNASPPSSTQENNTNKLTDSLYIKWNGWNNKAFGGNGQDG